MGYESTLIVGTALPSIDRHGFFFHDALAVIELGKVGYDNAWSDLLSSGRADLRYFRSYAVGSERGGVTHDCYDEPLQPLKIDAAIGALESVIAAEDDGRYLQAEVAVLVLQAVRGERDLVVLHYGH